MSYNVVTSVWKQKNFGFNIFNHIPCSKNNVLENNECLVEEPERFNRM